MKYRGTIKRINDLLNKKMWNAAMQEMKLLPKGKTKNNFWKVILKDYLEHGWVESAKEISEKRLNRELTEGDKEIALSYYIEHKLWHKVCEMMT